jgi:hypothetical protein
MLVMGVKDNPPAHIEQVRTGFQGEQQTAKAIADMPGWTVVHDVDGGRAGGNIDHIAVGRAGVFLIDSKWLVGRAEVMGDEVRLRRYEDPDLTYLAEGIGPRMRRMARATHDRVRATTHASAWVQPLVVFWGEFEAGVVESHGVVYVHGDRLREWLLGRPARYPEAHVTTLATAVAAEDGDTET